MDLLDDEQRRRIIAYHAQAEPWLERLPGLVATYRRRWRLAVGPTYRPGGEASWAAPVELPDGTAAVLKIGLPDPDGIDEAAALSVYAGRGVVRLLAHDAADRVLLIERCVPGNPATTLDPEEADEAAAGVLPQLWRAEMSTMTKVPQLSDITAQRAATVLDRARRLNQPLLHRGADLLTELAGTPNGKLVLLHGDFHQRNVLRSTRGWLAIDPRPMRGDRAHDIACYLVHRIIEDADPADRAARLAERLDMPPGRVHRWLAAQIIQLCSWLRVSGEPGPLEAYESAARHLLAAL